MVADTLSPIYGFLLQGTGNNPNSWGENLNDEVITLAENAIGGCLTISGLTGGAVSLTQAQALYNTIILTGTLSSDLVLTAPSTANRWTFINKLAGNFYVLFKTAGNTAVNIPRGKVLEITCDGTDMYRHDRESIGELFYHAGVVPAGALECTGATPLRLSAVDLFASISTTWGVGNGTTTFTIPDAYTAGKFLRSRTAAVALGTAQTNQNKAHTHTGSGTTAVESNSHTHGFSGTTSNMSANASHTHTSNAIAGSSSSPGGGFTVGGSSAASINSASTEHTHTYSGNTGDVSATHTHSYSFTTSSDGGTEARPENLSAILCIRY